MEARRLITREVVEFVDAGGKHSEGSHTMFAAAPSVVHTLTMDNDGGSNASGDGSNQRQQGSEESKTCKLQHMWAVCWQNSCTSTFQQDGKKVDHIPHCVALIRSFSHTGCAASSSGAANVCFMFVSSIAFSSDDALCTTTFVGAAIALIREWREVKVKLLHRKYVQVGNSNSCQDTQGARCATALGFCFQDELPFAVGWGVPPGTAERPSHTSFFSAVLNGLLKHLIYYCGVWG